MNELHSLLRCFLLTDLVIKHAHQVLDIVDLLGNLMAIVTVLGIRLVELIVSFLNISDGQSCRNQVSFQLFLDGGPFLIH